MDEISEGGRRGFARIAGGGVVSLLGLAVTVVPLFDIYDDVAAGKPPASTLLENAPLLVFALVVVAAGGWLARSERGSREVRTIVVWTVGGVGFALVVFSFVLGVQLYLQNDLKPLVIAADAVLIAALGGLVIGVRTAERRKAERRRFRGLFEHVPNPIAETRLDGDDALVRRVNPAFTNLFGYEQPAIAGEPLAEHIVPPGSDVEPLAEADVAGTSRRITSGTATSSTWRPSTAGGSSSDSRYRPTTTTAPAATASTSTSPHRNSAASASRCSRASSDTTFAIG